MSAIKKAMVKIEYRLLSDYLVISQSADRIANETGKLVEVVYRPKRTGRVDSISYHEPRKDEEMKKKKSFPRVPLPRQTGGFHRSKKGRGSYNRQHEKLAFRKGEI